MPRFHGPLANVCGPPPYTSEALSKRLLRRKGPFHPTNHSFCSASHRSLTPVELPPGRHTAWAYCHIPNGSTEDYTESIERQIVRFAPEFPDCILSRCVSTPKDLETWNPNLVGGDILGGAM